MAGQNKERNYAMNKILIIDDDRELCALIKRSVQSEHIEADFCNTGKEGLQKLKEQEYQLVVLDTGIRIESAADLCGRCLDDVATDVLYMTGNDHALEAADPLELAEIKRRWEPYINQLPDYAYLCKDLLNGKM